MAIGFIMKNKVMRQVRMERLVIIDHESHTLFIEDVSDEALAKYNGEEEAYINDNYCGHGNFSGNFSWDYITQTQYIRDCEDTEVYVINFDDVID